jgi:drug/metabolite transporter (DMT)-like permease
MSSRLSKRRAYLAWVVVCAVWGTTYLAIRVAIESLPPLLMAGFRWIVAGSLLIAWFRLRGERLPAPDGWVSLAVRGVLLVTLGNGAVVWAEQTVPSGVTSVLVAVAPFWMVGIDALFSDGESLSVRQAAGLAVGFAGVLVLIWPRLGTGVDARVFAGGVVATQVACAGWALGSSYARRLRHSERSNPAAPAFEMLFGGIALLGCSLVLGERMTQSVTLRSAIAVAYLIVFGSLIAFSSYRYALQHLAVATVSLYVYVNTVIAVILGTVVLAEPFNWPMGVGIGVVLLGIGLVKERNGRAGD